MKRLSAAKVLPALASLLTLGVGLAAMNDDVRRFVSGLFTTSARSGVSTASGQVQDAAMAVYQAVRDQSIAHAPLTIFVVAASVLLVFMLRT